MRTPPITITTLDLERLERLLAVSNIRSQPGSYLLLEELGRANVVEPEEIGADIVTMNSTVRFVDERSDTVHELTLVYPDRAGTPGTVSIFAPVGSALLGLSVGQSIEWPVPGGKKLELRVAAVIDQPESRREYYR